MTRVGSQRHSKKKSFFAGSHFKGIPGSGTALAKCILINCTAVCLPYLIRIWCSDCTVRDKFSYHSSLPCHDR